MILFILISFLIMKNKAPDSIQSFTELLDDF